MKTYKWFFLILVAGAFAACQNDSEEPLVGNWTWMGQIDGPGRGHAASFILKQGDKEYGYVCCGSNGTKTRRKDFFRFDCETWTQLPDFAGKARSQACGFAVDGKGYVGSGWDGNEDIMNDFWEYDPSANTWTEIAPLPGKARHSAIAFALKVGGKEYGYVGTGNTEGNDRETLKDFWKFDPRGSTEIITEEGAKTMKGKWELINTHARFSKRYGATVFIINNKAYVCNGNGSGFPVTDFWQFDPDGELSGKSLWTELRKMSNANPDEDYDDEYGDLARYYGVSFTMPGGDDEKMKGYIALGSNSKSSTWEYDPITDLWVQRTRHINYLTPRSKEGATAFSFTGVNRAFVCMGLQGTTPTDDVREFFPTEEDNVYDD